MMALVCLGPGLMGSAEAAKHELNYFQYSKYEDAGRQWLRIEIGMTGKQLEFASEVREIKPKQLKLTLQNTENDKLKKDISLDREIAKYMTIRDAGKKAAEIVITLATPVAEHDYRVYTMEPERRAKKPYRLVIEIAEDKLPEAEPQKPYSDTVLPNLAGHHIVIDPGHGGSDSGARGPHGLMEKNVTLAICRDVDEILRANGAQVAMTRYSDVDVYGPMATDRQELQARVDVGLVNPDTELFVSVHCNAFTSPDAHGTGTYYYPHSQRDTAIAQAIQDEMVQATGLRDRGINYARFYVLRNASMPATLVETAFISNYQEEFLLGQEQFRHNMAVAICRGISKYFGAQG